MEFDGQVALVTGGGQGIGAETARMLAAGGAKVVLADWNEEAARGIAAEIEGKGGTAQAVLCDVSKKEDAEAAVALAVKDYGRVDILINNAGITRDSSLLKMEPHQWEQVIGINLTGIFFMSQAAGRAMRDQQYGRIVSASSTSAFGNFGQSNYSATKAGVLGITRTMSIELARYGVTVNAIAPGFIETAMTDAIPAEQRELAASKIPVGRIGVPADIARTYLFLASPQASFITGQLIIVDGGRMVAR
ncbi:MAG: glucose 1-dehydrogenase [bacterium]